MTWYEILIIIACLLIVFGVAIGSVVRKKKNKGKGGCGCGCAGCSGCSVLKSYKKPTEKEQ